MNRRTPHTPPRALPGRSLWTPPAAPLTCLAPAQEHAQGLIGRWPADAEPIGAMLYLAKRIDRAADFEELADLQSAVERDWVNGRINAGDRMSLLAISGRRFRDLVAKTEAHPQHDNMRSVRALARSL